MDKETNHSKNKNDTKKPSGRRNHYIGRDTMEWNERIRSMQGIGKERWTSMRRRWNHLCRWKNLYTKQPENQREDTSGKP